MQNITKCKHYSTYYLINEGAYHKCKLRKWETPYIKCPEQCPDYEIKKSAIQELCKDVFYHIGTHLLQTSTGSTYFDRVELELLSDKADFTTFDELFEAKHYWFTNALKERGLVMYRLVHSRKVIEAYKQHLSIEPNIMNLDYTESKYNVKWYDIHPQKVQKQLMDYSFFLNLYNKGATKDTIKKAMNITPKEYQGLYNEAKYNGHLNQKVYGKNYTFDQRKKLWKVEKCIDGKRYIYGYYKNEWEAMMIVEEMKRRDWDKSRLREVQEVVEDYFKDKEISEWI